MDNDNKPTKFCYPYPHAAITADCIVFGYDPNKTLRVLLVKRRNGYGGMLCVNFKGGMAEINKLIQSLQIVRFVPTLAGVGTTLTYPPKASHRDLNQEELAAIGITMGQIRLSSGLEDTADLLNDFDQALAKL